VETDFVRGDYGKGILVILGAGASFDALGRAGYGISPPLTNRLADSSSYTSPIVDKYPLARPVLVKLRQAISQSTNANLREQSFSLEETLAEFRRNSDRNAMTMHQITAFRFYLRDLLYQTALKVHGQNEGINAYSHLVQDLVNWSNRTNQIVCFINFNFDPLLEWACEVEIPFKAERLMDYYVGERIFVLKPHGSVLWSWEDEGIPEEPNTEPYDSVIDCGEPTDTQLLTLHATKTPVDMFPDRQTNLFSCAYPALALPMAGEKAFVWPEEQEYLFRNRFQIGAFGKILTIGWRGNEKHFVDLLPSRVSDNRSLWTVTSDEPGDCEEILRNLSQIVSPVTGRVQLTNGFHDFVYSEMLGNFINQ
jgi:hypothetical protein